MRKCIALEDEPGFQRIRSPILQQAIDKGLSGYGTTGVINWGYKKNKPKKKQP